ncbi:MAG: nucleotidyltransferase [Solirubrobacteraceae bacterium]
MPSDDEQPFGEIEHALKRAAAALRDAGVPFLSAGASPAGRAAGPRRATTSTSSSARRTWRPPSRRSPRPACAPSARRRSGSSKAWDGDTLVDLIYCLKGLPVDDDVIARGEKLSVLGMEIRVMALEDVMATKLLALTEHSLRYEGLLQIARALREQIDWPAVRERTRSSPFARAFFTLAEGLDILPASTSRGASEPRVSVVTQPGSTSTQGG